MKNSAFLDTSLHYFEKAIVTNNYKNYDVYYERGVLYRNDSGDYAKAIQDFKTSIEINPFHLYSHLNLGWCLKFNNQIEESYIAFKNAMKYFPNNKQVKKGINEMEKLINR